MTARHSMLKDVAREASVSVSTVSRALRGRTGVSAGVRARVTRLAKKLNYVPDHSARSLVLGKTGLIGLVTAPLYEMTPREEALSRLETLARANGKRIVHLSYTHTEVEKVASVAREQRWEGMLLFADALPAAVPESVTFLRDFGMPVILLDGWIMDGPDSVMDSVMYDRGYGVRLLLDHAAKLGRRRIGLISGSAEIENDTESGKYYRLFDELKARRMELVFTVSYDCGIRHGAHLFNAARKAVDRGLANGCDADFVMGANDVIAVAAMNSLLDHGYRVPEDIAVTGYDDNEAAVYARPQLTTITRPLEEMVELGWGMLKRRLHGDTAKPKTVSLLPSLVVRGSTGAGQELDRTERRKCRESSE